MWCLLIGRRSFFNVTTVHLHFSMGAFLWRQSQWQWQCHHCAFAYFSFTQCISQCSVCTSSFGLEEAKLCKQHIDVQLQWDILQMELILETAVCYLLRCNIYLYSYSYLHLHLYLYLYLPWWVHLVVSFAAVKDADARHTLQIHEDLSSPRHRLI